MHGNFPYIFDGWANLGVYITLIKSFMTVVMVQMFQVKTYISSA